jgi:hypothetical protein
MLIPDYIAIGVLIVLALWAGVARFPFPNPPRRRSEAALIALGQSGGRTMRAVFWHGGIYLPLPQYPLDC